MSRRRWARRLAWTLLGVLLLPLPLTLLLRVVQPPTTAIILARTVQRLLDGERPAYPQRTVVARDAVAPSLYRAVLASEDDRFYLHHGFDFTEIEKALADRRAGRRSRGASTLSQQVVKNIFLWEGRSWVRKGLEAYITLWLEVVVPKDRILDLYVNLAEWGDGVFGIEAAAQHHFGKSARALTRTESARLAAILPAPRRWPANGTVAGGRAATILPRMAYPAPRPSTPRATSPRTTSPRADGLRAPRYPHNSGLVFPSRPV